jgi:hypothetical protein
MSGINAMDLDIGAATLPLARATSRATTAQEQRPRFRDDLRQAAEQLVASALLMPIFQQMASSPLRPQDGPFAANTVEKRFGPLLHEHLADRMMHSRSFGLVDAVIGRLSLKSGPAETSMEVIA